MREMKDSGIEWIGKIPEDWKVIRVKDEYVFDTGFTPDTKHSEYYSDDEGHEWVTISDIVDGKIQHPTKSLISRDYVSATHRKKVPSGALLYSFKLSVGTTAIADEDIFTNEAIASFFPTSNVNIGFLKYSSSLIEFNGNTNIYGATILNQKLINDAHIVFPSLNEQQTIADFLDSKCAEIDALSADIQSEIDTLEAYKRSVITEAVTKGLDKNAPMKDSGVPWIGEIPKGWTINRVKYLFDSGKGLSITKDNLVDEGLPVISYGQIHSKSNTGVSIAPELLRFVDLSYQKRFPQCYIGKYDFVFADTSEDYDGCGNCAYKRDDSVLFGGYHAVILHAKTKRDNRYLAYLFKTDEWRKQIRTVVSGVKVFSITQRVIMDASVILPSFEEQQKISNYLDDKCAEIDAIIAQRQEQLAVLADYKKSTIYEYVTGKKEVPVA